MKTAARLSAYGVAVVLLGAGAFATGMTVDVPTGHLRPTADSGPAGPGGGHGATPAAGPAQRVQPAGPASTAVGFTVPTTGSAPVAAPASGQGDGHGEGVR